MGRRWIFLFCCLFISLIAKGRAEDITSGTNISQPLPPPVTLYTYQSGNWNNPDVWTTDPGGTTLTGSRIPGDGDEVVVLPSRTLTLTADIANTGISIVILEGAIFDASVYKFNNSLASLSGKGTYRLKSAAFPSVETDLFSGVDGGTVEYYNNTDINLTASQTSYNNLIINCSGYMVTQLNNISVNGNLVVGSGTFRINDWTNARLTLVIKGDVTVNTGASIIVGAGKTITNTNPVLAGAGGTAPFLDYYVGQSHRVEIYGDFTNNGTVRFTNQPFPVFNAFPLDGIASVFFRGSSDNTLTCNGTTDFYNLIIDKGTDQTFILTLNSAGYDKFRLFGANNAGESTVTDPSNPNIRKALWIHSGTLRLTGDIFIPSLVEGSASGSGHFFIPGNGALILDGPDVVVIGTCDDYRTVNLPYGVNGGSGAVNGITTLPSQVPSAVSLYGKLQINDGYFYTGEIGRVIYYGTASAEFIINGGTIDIKQFQSVSGGGKTAFWQTAGNLVLRGRFKRNLDYSDISSLISSIGNTSKLNTQRSVDSGGNNLGTDPNVGTLDIDQDANIFHMEGGTISVFDVSGTTGTPRAIEINSDPSNISITGGNIGVYITSGTALADASYGIASKAPLYNLTITRTSGSQPATLLNIPSRTGVTGAPMLPLCVINNLILSNTSGNVSPVLNAGTYSLIVGNDFTIQPNAVYNPGTNRTILNGSGNQTFTNGGTITNGLYRFIVDKESGTATMGTNIVIRDSLVLNGGILNDNGHIIQVAGNIFAAGSHQGTGKIQLNGTVPQNIGVSPGSTGSLGNIEVNNPYGLGGEISVSVLGDLSVNSLTLTTEGSFYIGSNRLTIGEGGMPGGLIYNVLRMIRTNGFSSDGGLRRYISGTYNNSTVLFPVGCPGGPRNTIVAYFPGKLFLGTVTSPGYYTIVPVSGYHPSCDVQKKNQALDFYWKTKIFGLATSGTRHIEFQYRENISNNYNNPYYLLTGSNTWDGTSGTDNSPLLIIPTSIGIASGDFTCGKSKPFRDPTTFYSRRSGEWSAYSGGYYTTWSLTGHNGSPASDLPQNYDNVIIGGIPGSRNDSVTIGGNGIKAAIITIKGSYTSNNHSPVLNIQSTTGHTIDIIRGAGKFCISSSSLPSSPTDFGDFLSNDTAVFNYYGGTYTLPSSITSYPNLLISGNNIKYLGGNTTVKGNLIIADESSSNNRLSLNSTSGNLTVYGNLFVKNGGKLIVPASSTPRNISIYGNIDLTYGGTNDVNAIEAASGSGAVHKLNFFGSEIYSGSSNLNFNSSGPNRIDLYFKNPGNTTITDGSGSFLLNKLYIQKNSVGDFVFFSHDFSLNESDNATASKSLNLFTGTLVLSDPANSNPSGINLNLSSGGTNFFNISSSSGLILRNGAKANISGKTSGSGIHLDGLLQTENDSQLNLADGSLNNTGYIEYSGSGNAIINLSGSSVLKTAQVRRSLSLTTGILKLKLNGSSSVIVYGTGTAGIIDPSRAKLEVTGTGSEFNMSGTSSLTIINGGGNTFGDLYLRPGSSSVTGGNIFFGTGTSGKLYKMDAAIPLNNLIVNSTGTANDVQLMISPLVLNGSLVLNNPGSSFSPGNANVTINGDLTVNGIYNASSNTTIFSGATQSISGTSDPLFHDLTINPSLKVTLNRDITVNGDLTISGGKLDATAYNTTVKGNISNNGSYANNPAPSVNRIYLNGNFVQHIGGNGSFGRVELDNFSGARLVNDLLLNDNLKLTNGVLDINQYKLTLGINSFVEGSGFCSSKMIKSDGVFSNGGIVKNFSSGYSGIFIFPSGVTGKYTPAVLLVGATGSGSVRVNVIDSRHPATLSPFNVLNYYWEIESNLSAFEGNVTLCYSPSDITGDESQYVASRLMIPPGTGWSKAAPGVLTDNVDEGAHSIFFGFPAGTANLGGQYTAGLASDLPSSIPVYTSNVISGSWDTPESWSPVAPAGGPNGFIVVIQPGNTILTNGNRRFAFKTTIDGTLDVGTTYGHNLGTVEGTGTLSLKQANLPAGDFKSFLSKTGGTLEYGGSTDYTIVADRIDTVRNLFFTGSGIRTLPDKNLVISNQLLINGPVLDNRFNRKLTIGGSFDLSSGTFLSGSGNGATVTFNGASPQTISGFNSSSALNNLEVNNASGLTLNSVVELNGNLLLTNGVITSTAVNKLKMINQLTSTFVIPEGGSASSYVNGPMSKFLSGGSEFVFPSGKSGRYGKMKLYNVQSGTWEAEYYNTPYSNLTFSGLLMKSSSTEYWRIKSPANNKTAVIELRWDNNSDITPVTTTNGTDDIRIAEFNGVSWIDKPSSAPGGNDSDGTVKTSSNIPVGSTANPQYYTLGSVSSVKPTITLLPVPNVCRCSTSALLPYSTTTGTPNQYKIDFDAAANAAGFTDTPVWTALPSSPITFVVPSAASPGTYHGSIVVRTSVPVNTSIPYNFTVTMTSEQLWTGASGNNWGQPANWKCGNVPGVSADIRIPDTPNKPSLFSGTTAAVHNLIIDNNSSLTLTGTLRISGTITNNGSLDASLGTLEYNGTMPQTIPVNLLSGNKIMNLIINNVSGVTLSGLLNISNVLTLQAGQFTSGGNITLLSTSLATALISGAGTGTITGNVTMQRYLDSGFGYRYISSPFQSASVGEFSDDMDLASAFPLFYSYDENRYFSTFPVTPWVSMTDPSAILTPMKGYSINFGSDSSPKTIDVSGVVNSGPVTLNLYNHNHPYTAGFNLVGNPYPSPIDWGAASGWTKTNIDNALYYYKSSSSDQFGGTYSSWINGVSSDGIASGIIPAMQGFLVHVADGAYPVTGILAMDNRVRVNNVNPSFAKKGAFAEEKSMIRVCASFAGDVSHSDNLVIYTDYEATWDFDNQLDALKFFNTEVTMPNLYSFGNDGSWLSINSIPELYGALPPIAIGVSTYADGEVVFSMKDNTGEFSSKNVYLFDSYTGEAHSLLSGAEYRTYLSAGDYTGRFFINFENLTTGTGNNDMLKKPALIYSSGERIYAEINCISGKPGMISVSNITGQTLYTEKIYNNGHHEITPAVKTGLYIVRFVCGNVIVSEKLYISGQ
jgi:hypothetical protein